MSGGGTLNTYEHSRSLSPDCESIPENADLGKYISSVDTSSNDQKYRLLTQPFVPNKYYAFPQCTKYGEKKRSFQVSWLEKYNGLVYSPFLNEGLCKYCVLFAKNRESLGTFVNSPFTELWKALKQHFGKENEIGRETHRHAMEDALHFKMMIEGKAEPIDRQLDKQLSERVIENRCKLLSILKKIIFCGQQNISLGGHRDEGEHNVGNFQALLQFRIDAGVKVWRSTLRQPAKTAHIAPKPYGMN